MANKQEKSPVEQLLERAGDLQRGFKHASQYASGDKAGMYREILKVVEFAGQIAENQATLDRRLANIEGILNLTGQETAEQASLTRVQTIKLPAR